MSGCEDGGTPSEQRAHGTILLAASTQSDSGVDAPIAGTLIRTDSGCLALAADNDIHVLQFPFGTRLADDGESANVPGLGVVRTGERIDGAGGYIDVRSAPKDCHDIAEFAVWERVAD